MNWDNDTSLSDDDFDAAVDLAREFMETTYPRPKDPEAIRVLKENLNLTLLEAREVLRVAIIS
jgi:hypothetical protein